MKKVTFMIGNGFDINSGLKSTYLASYKGYTEQESATENIAKFKKIIKNDMETWADFEMQMAQYAKEFDKEEYFIECVLDYIVYLENYLQSEENLFLSKMEKDVAIGSAVAKELKDSITNFYEGLAAPKDIRQIETVLGRRTDTITYSIICFNYTKVLDEIAKKAFDSNFAGALHELGRIIHIHGTLDSDVVLGLDNEEQLDVPFELTSDGRRVFIKPAFNEEFDDERQMSAEMAIETSDVLCVYGLELGESDLRWRNAIKNWLLKDKKHHLVFYRYVYSGKQYRLAQEKLADEERFKKEIIHLLFGVDLNENDAYSFREQIHIPVGINIFNIKDALEKGGQLAQKKEELKDRLHK